MKTFVCLLAFATAFVKVQKIMQPKMEQPEEETEPSLGKEMLHEFCKN